jgi:quercetin dioxygenase-like cupin family protein
MEQTKQNEMASSHHGDDASTEEERPQERSMTGSSAILFDLRTLSQFRNDGPYVQVLSDIETARLVLFTFRAGQRLAEQKTSSQLLVQVLRGRVSFGTPDNTVRLQAGMVLQVESHVPHSVVALTDAVMLLTLTPSPGYHNHEHDPFHHLTPLVSRAKPIK